MVEYRVAFLSVGNTFEMAREEYRARGMKMTMTMTHSDKVFTRG